VPSILHYRALSLNRRLVSATILTLFSAPFRGSSGAPQYMKHVGYQLMRSIETALSSEQAQ